ncbi:UDP-glucuronic acid decarboxylase 1 [Geodia barretti]|uniref:UDP-glucuronic acid decarboxylase 1 n=1 Tax=Geodia barretti TaxID=519541 RepID=A0AA35TMJ7_GEOBA|nr:UDP-glucuronic acid decarboxylase 1 [Geodia barretti]
MPLPCQAGVQPVGVTNSPTLLTSPTHHRLGERTSTLPQSSRHSSQASPTTPPGGGRFSGFSGKKQVPAPLRSRASYTHESAVSTTPQVHFQLDTQRKSTILVDLQVKKLASEIEELKQCLMQEVKARVDLETKVSVFSLVAIALTRYVSQDASSGDAGRDQESMVSQIISEVQGLFKQEMKELEHRIRLLEEDSIFKGKREAFIPLKSSQSYPPVFLLPEGERKRILVTGGAGFVGSHLVDRLMRDGHEVRMYK